MRVQTASSPGQTRLPGAKRPRLARTSASRAASRRGQRPAPRLAPAPLDPADPARSCRPACSCPARRAADHGDQNADGVVDRAVGADGGDAKQHHLPPPAPRSQHPGASPAAPRAVSRPRSRRSQGPRSLRCHAERPCAGSRIRRTRDLVRVGVHGFVLSEEVLENSGGGSRDLRRGARHTAAAARFPGRLRALVEGAAGVGVAR